ncbi:MAG: ribonuclease HII [Alphaproteobacteria bacterium]
MPDFAIERRYGGIVCGVDEAGRGPLAGPVVAAAVVIDRRRFRGELRRVLDDSKVLSRELRERCYDGLRAGARGGIVGIGVGAASAAEIDRLNVLRANLLAMCRAVAALAARTGIAPDVALVDGNIAPPLPCAVRTVVRGDSASLSIAAASIVAKVTRDRIMHALALRHPGYGWETNAGYPTATHVEAIRRLGVTPHHRRSFAPIRAALSLSADLPAPLETGPLAPSESATPRLN